MARVPKEFTPEGVKAASGPDAFRPYRDAIKKNNGLPLTFYKNNPWLKPPREGSKLEFGKFQSGEWDGYPLHYYDTLPTSRHPHYRDKDCPTPTKDMQRLRHDLFTWGYCLIEDGLSPEQVERMRRRVEEQAAGERAAGIAYTSPSFQIMWSLVNKGEVFEKIMQHDVEAVQAGPVIEQLLNELLGKGWYALSMAANIAFPGCHPQPLHQDEPVPGWTIQNAPTLVNTMYVLQDVNEINGGTLFIPGSHKIIEEAQNCGEPIGRLPPSVNLEAPAGTVMLFDGRVLHGTGANRTDQWRYVCTQANIKPWLRQQENTMLNVKPEVLNRATDKLLQRLGFQSNGFMHAEGYGTFGVGAPGDPKGALVRVRQAVDRGEHRRVGELTKELGEALAPDAFTLQLLQGPDGEGEARKKANEHARHMDASIGLGSPPPRTSSKL